MVFFLLIVYFKSFFLLNLFIFVYKENGSRRVRVIHNYGHGGSGVTLFWGCAMNVLELLAEDGGGPIKSKL